MMRVIRLMSYFVQEQMPLMVIEIVRIGIGIRNRRGGALFLANLAREFRKAQLPVRGLA
jgi:hypothetical protein